MPDIIKRAFTRHHKIMSIKKVGDSNLYSHFYISFCKGNKWQWGVVWLYFHFKFMWFFFSYYISFISYFTAKLLHQYTGTLLHLCACLWKGPFTLHNAEGCCRYSTEPLKWHQLKAAEIESLFFFFLKLTKGHGWVKNTLVHTKRGSQAQTTTHNLNSWSVNAFLLLVAELVLSIRRMDRRANKAVEVKICKDGVSMGYK